MAAYLAVTWIVLLWGLVPVRAITAWAPVTRFCGIREVFGPKTYSTTTYIPYNNSPVRGPAASATGTPITYAPVENGYYTTTTHLNVISLPSDITPITTITSIDTIAGVTYHSQCVDLATFPRLAEYLYISSSTVDSTLISEITTETPPPFCTGKLKTDWTHTMLTTVDLPQELRPQVTPISTWTSVGTTTTLGTPYQNNPRYVSTVETGTISYTVWILSSGSLMTPTPRPQEPEPETLEEKKVACQYPPTRSSLHRKSETWRPLTVRLVIAAAVILMLGFVENYWWFRRMMRGEWALRFGTVRWSLLLIGLYLTRRIEQKEGVGNRRVLAEKWHVMTWKEKMALWIKWGFRWRYPVELLGEAPKNEPRARRKPKAGVATHVPNVQVPRKAARQYV